VIIGMDAGPGARSCEGFGSGEHVMKRKQVLLPRTVAWQIEVTLGATPGGYTSKSSVCRKA
jgi:hypothetical protein